MYDLPRPLLAVARDQLGLVTIDDLVRCGVSKRQRRRLVESGFLIGVHRGVLRFASHPVTFEQRCLAALSFAPDAVLSGPTAARVWGLRKVVTDDVHILARRTIHVTSINAHQTDLLRSADVVVHRGLRVLRPTRLLCDLAWHLDDAALESVFEQMLERHLTTVQTARRAARAFCKQGRPGSVRLARVLESRPEWMRPPDSDLELRLHRALAAAGLELDRQVRVELDSGVVAIDLADRALLFGIEVDHVRWHNGRLDVERDKRRDRELTRRGWTVSRVTDSDVDERLAETVGQLVAIWHLLRHRASSTGRRLS
ncbi:MAG: type IV toxin-antitoxin system AbiEi family antitoxin domain-containing protein [Acidimicrobiia bacterium]